MKSAISELGCTWKSKSIRSIIEKARVARLGTLNADGTVHLVPIVFANTSSALYFVIDGKRKRTKYLRRLQNIQRTGKATLLVDEYSENWNELKFVMINAGARVLKDGSRKEVGKALRLLRQKYPQYSTGQYLSRVVQDRLVIRLTPLRVVPWSQSGSLSKCRISSASEANFSG